MLHGVVLGAHAKLHMTLVLLSSAAASEPVVGQSMLPQDSGSLLTRLPQFTFPKYPVILSMNGKEEWLSELVTECLAQVVFDPESLGS